MPVPNQFANVTTSIPLSQLDANFNTPITLGNTAIQLGNTVTTLNNMTLANVSISSGSINVTSGNITVTNATVTTANVTTANIATEIVTTSQTLNYGTANCVAYLNTNKVTTANTGLAYDGSTFRIGSNLTRAAYFSSVGIPTFRYDDNSIVQSIKLNNLGITSAGHGAAIAAFLSTDGTNQYNAGGIGFQATNSYSSTASTQDSNFFVQVAVDGVNTSVATFTTAGNIAMAQADKGIDFSVNSQAAGATSEVLNDYEEGTWTPVIQGGTTAGTTSYTQQEGRYTKIGRQVTVWFYVDATAATGTGGFYIAGLPFSSNATINQTTGALMTDRLNWTGGSSPVTYMGGGVSVFQIYISSDDAGWNQQQMVNEAFAILGTHTYFV